MVSAGGVGDSLGKASGGALVAAVKADPALQETVANELVDLLPRRRAWTGSPCRCSASWTCCFRPGRSPPSPLHIPPTRPMRSRTRSPKTSVPSSKGSRDVAKLCHGVQALSHVAALGPNVVNSDRCARTSGLQGILALMVSRYPGVRGRFRGVIRFTSRFRRGGCRRGYRGGD